jgi:hypothetical protein
MKSNHTPVIKSNSKGKSTLTVFNIAVLTCILFFIYSCGDKKSDTGIVAPQGMHILDLSRYGKPFAIFVPDTVAAKLIITEQSTGALDIKVGKNFAITINEQPADIELRKTDIQEDEINKFKSFVINEPNALIWESGWEGAANEPQFHFVLNHKIGNSDYCFEDLKDPDANTFGKEAIQRMFDSSKNVKEVNNETKP